MANRCSVKGFGGALTSRTTAATMGIITVVAHTPNPPRMLLAAAVGLLALVPGGPALAQADSIPEPEGFRRQYLDAGAYRTAALTLREWPDLGALVRWSRQLERAVAEDDQTLSGELLAEFRVRVDSLGSRPLPAFMERSADSVQVALDSLEAHLDRADAWLAALPPVPVRSDGEAVNEASNQRTLVTGNTAVTVPPGVRVGTEDSLPTAELPGEEENFVDLVHRALADLDRLVHLVRTSGRRAGGPASESQPPPAPSPSPDTGPPPRER